MNQLRGKVVNHLKILTLIAISLLTSACANNTPLHWMGLNPDYEVGSYDLQGKKALIIATNQDRLGEGPDADPTGAASSEVTHPYYSFKDNGIQVELASIKGGKIAIDPQTIRFPAVTPHDKHALEDTVYQQKLLHSLRVSDINFTEYDIIYLAGGWGAAYDLGYSEVLGEKISEAYASDRIVGGVCHGPLGLLKATKPDGSPLVKGVRLTAVTDKQVKELGITATPQHPENELRKQGALFESKTKFRDFFATHVVVDGKIVTGQNQNSGLETADEMMQLLSAQ